MKNVLWLEIIFAGHDLFVSKEIYKGLKSHSPECNPSIERHLRGRQRVTYQKS